MRGFKQGTYCWQLASAGLLAAMGAITTAALPASIAGFLPVGVLPAQAQRLRPIALDHAICANDWDKAVSLVSRLIADDDTTSSQRIELMTLRRDLEGYRSEDTIVMDPLACDRSDPYTLDAFTPESMQAGIDPLGWEAAVAEATDNRYSTAVITESVPLTLPVKIDEPLGLTPAEPIDLSLGLNVVAGQVGTGHNVYAFVAGRGDRVDANLEVTRVMKGSLYTSDDSQLFIFDRFGNLVTFADDSDGTQASSINGLIIPQTGLYFAVVTSYNNDPILNSEGQLTGWQDNGGGRFDYTLSLSGATPTSALLMR